MSAAVLTSDNPAHSRRFDRWILDRVRKRRGSPQLPFTLEYRHIYVMPTRFGFWFGTLLAAMALAGLNFNNNMSLMLAFLLGAIAQLTTLLAYRNLVGMTITGFRAAPVFAGHAARFGILPEARCLVFPAPSLNPPPLPRVGRGDYGAAQKGEGDHFHGLREYQTGDPLRRVAWRTSARHQKLYSRVMETPSEEACEFNWYLMGSGDTESKLSVLTAWILRAERRQIPYSLEMPADALPSGLGEEHRDACLKILALFEQ
jgi:uncharacterized protein (DUF58 family)